MTTNRFRSVALVLRDYVSDTYALLAAADAVTALDHEIQPERPVITSPDKHATYNWNTGLWDFDHEYLVSQALDNDVVRMYVGQNKKINAIKELRRCVPGAGLKASKEAVEDDRVQAAGEDPWVFPENPEPPF